MLWQAYEETHLVPSPTNFEVAKHSVEEILYRVPNAFGLKHFARRLSVCLMGDRLREAMMYVYFASSF